MISQVPLFRPYYVPEAIDGVLDVLQSGWLGLGPKVEEFEHKFAVRVGARHAVATNSCTAALQIALLCHDIGRGDEVIVPTMTFVSTAHAVAAVGARPVFCDVYENSLLMDEFTFEKTHRTRAAIPVMYAGHPQLHRGVNNVSAIDGIPLIYDCAHACGSAFNARGLTCCWSFHAVKNLACGDGGMLTTDDSDIATKARKLRWLGIDKDTYSRTNGGYDWNYSCNDLRGIKGHMNDITAAIGLAQLAALDSMQDIRDEVAVMYRSRLDCSDLYESVSVPYPLVGHGWHLYVIRAADRDALATHLKVHGVSTGVHYKPIHTHRCYGIQSIQPTLPVAEAEFEKILSLPMHANLTGPEVNRVCDLILGFYEKCG